MKTFSRKIFTLLFYQSAVILSIYNLIFPNVFYIILYMRNKKGITALILAVILIFTSLTSCKRRDYADFTAFASPVHIEVYGKTLSEETVKEIRELFALLTTFLKYPLTATILPTENLTLRSCRSRNYGGSTPIFPYTISLRLPPTK